MSFTPENSAIKVTPAVEEHLRTLTSAEEIKDYLASVAVDQRLVTRDVYSPDILIPTALASGAPKKVSRVINLNGVKHALVADDEAGLLAQETTLYREVLAQPTTTEPVTQPRNER